MPTLEHLQAEIETIKQRNQRVELDKKWETSSTRKLSIFVLTYLVIVIFFVVIEVANPLLNAIVPALGFLLSTLTLPFIKDWWIKRQRE